MKTTRVFQLTALVLVVISRSCRSAGGCIDQRNFTIEKARTSRMLCMRRKSAPRRRCSMPGVRRSACASCCRASTINGGQASLGVETRSMAITRNEQAEPQLNQYVWESAFFLFALGAVHRRDLAGAARRGARAAGAGQLPRAGLASVQDAAREPAALAGDDGDAHALAAGTARTLIDRMLADIARMETHGHAHPGQRAARARARDAASASRSISAPRSRASSASSRSARRKDRIAFAAEVPPGLEVLADPLARRRRDAQSARERARGRGARGRRHDHARRARRVNDEIELTVRDTGVGFKPADSAQLFQQVLAPACRQRQQHHGTGLGLFIVRRMMQLAGGRVSAHSDGEGQGAQFVLAWPVAPAESR